MRAATASAPDRVADEPAPVPGRRTVLRQVARDPRPLVELRTLDQACALIDEWIAAHRDRLREILKLQDRLFWAEHRSEVHRFTAEFLRAQLKMNGITPADEVDLSKLPVDLFTVKAP